MQRLDDRFHFGRTHQADPELPATHLKLPAAKPTLAIDSWPPTGRDPMAVGWDPFANAQSNCLTRPRVLCVRQGRGALGCLAFTHSATSKDNLHEPNRLARRCRRHRALRARLFRAALRERSTRRAMDCRRSRVEDVFLPGDLSLTEPRFHRMRATLESRPGTPKESLRHPKSPPTSSLPDTRPRRSTSSCVMSRNVSMCPGAQVHRRSSRTRTCAKTAHRIRTHRTSLAPDRRDQGLRKTPGSCRPPPGRLLAELSGRPCAPQQSLTLWRFGASDRFLSARFPC